MQKRNFTAGTALVMLLVLTLAAMQFTLAQGPANPGERDHLRGLKRALEQAGAAALSADQEAAINTLITDFRSGIREQGPNADLRAAHEAYNAAILQGNIGAAEAQAELIAALSSTGLADRLKAEAGVKIQILGILTADQIDALTALVGTQGLGRLLSSLVSPPMGRGGRGSGGPQAPRSGGGRGPGGPPGGN